MLTLNGKKFAAGSSGLVDSLFTGGGTADGYFKRLRDGVHIYAPDGRKIAVITPKRVLARADKMDCGRFWYSYGDPDIIGRYESYSQMMTEIDSVLKETGFSN